MVELSILVGTIVGWVSSDQKILSSYRYARLGSFGQKLAFEIPYLGFSESDSLALSHDTTTHLERSENNWASAVENRRNALDNQDVRFHFTSTPTVAKRYHDPIRFSRSKGRRVEAGFTGAEVTSNGGAMLLAEADRRGGVRSFLSVL